MAISDKHSTNKSVKAGGKNSTTAKFVKPSTLSATTKANNVAKKAMLGEQKSLAAQAKGVKKGYLTQNEAQVLQKRKQTRKPVI